MRPAQPDQAAGHWVATWGAAPQLATPADLPPHPFTDHGRVLAGCTLRQTLHTSLGGSALRLRISNAFGTSPLVVGPVAVAHPEGGLAGVSALGDGPRQPVTFHGRSTVTIPPGAQMLSDPVDLPVDPRTNLTVTLYLPQGHPADSVTAHPGSRTTSYVAAGEHPDAGDLPGAVAVEHWYLLSAVEVWAPPAASTMVVLGDSLSDGRGSTTDHNDRWPDVLAQRLHAHPPTALTAVLNQSMGGNRVLADGIGPGVLARVDRDLFGFDGVGSVVVFAGINDLGSAPATPDAQRRVAQDLIAAYDQVVCRAHTRGIRVFAATLMAFGGNSDYDDPDGHREHTRQTVNAWIRDAGRLDGVFDFDRATRDRRDPRRLRESVDCGDHLHLNPAGYRALAEAVPLDQLVPGDLPAGFGVR